MPEIFHSFILIILVVAFSGGPLHARRLTFIARTLISVAASRPLWAPPATNSSPAGTSPAAVGYNFTNYFVIVARPEAELRNGGT